MTIHELLPGGLGFHPRPFMRLTGSVPRKTDKMVNVAVNEVRHGEGRCSSVWVVEFTRSETEARPPSHRSAERLAISYKKDELIGLNGRVWLGTALPQAGDRRRRRSTGSARIGLSSSVWPITFAATATDFRACERASSHSGAVRGGSDRQGTPRRIR